MKLLVSAWVLTLVLCLAEGQSWLLMVANHPQIDHGGRVIKMNLGDYSFADINVDEDVYWPIALDYDKEEKKIYWSEASASYRRIRRSDFDGGDVETVYTASQDDSVIGGLAVDWEKRLLFYTDETIDIIGKLTLPGFAQSVVISENLDTPRAIAVNTEAMVMYWADIGRGKIEKANYEVSWRRDVVVGLSHVSGLMLDVLNERVYWVDAGTNMVEYSDLDGNGRSEVFHGASLYTFYGLALYKDVLYLADWGQHAYDTNDSRVVHLEVEEEGGYIIETFNSHRLTDFHVAGSNPLLPMAGTGWTGVAACLSVALALTMG